MSVAMGPSSTTTAYSDGQEKTHGSELEISSTGWASSLCSCKATRAVQVPVQLSGQMRRYKDMDYAGAFQYFFIESQNEQISG